MAYNKDNNADLGNQTIEGTQPPTVLDAEIVMPENNIPTAEDLDAQLAALMAEPTEPVIVAAPPPQDDLDAQLAALMAETETEPADEIDEINAQIDAILNEQNWTEDEPQETPPVIVAEPVNDTDNDAVIIPAMPTESEPQNEENEEPATIILGEPENETDSEPVSEPAPAQTENTETADIADTAETADTADTVNIADTVDAVDNYTAEETAENDNNTQADEAREMLEQTKRLMEQIQAQAQAQAQTQAQQAAFSPAQNNTEAESLEMMRQAQMVLEQARREQELANQTMQAAQKQALQSQMAASSNPYNAQTHDVDRLKNELDGMRELVNRLTLTISQLQNGTPQQQMPQQQMPLQQMPFMYAQQQQPRHDSEDRDQYRKLESELEHMRREIMEKDLRDREKELDRRQKEAENTVKDIRPEMVQMSDSRDIAPMGNANGPMGGMGGEFIPLANGVYYSIKDKQVYVMTPASNAAAASPTIEPKRPAPARRPAPPKRRPAVAAHRRPGAPLRHRPGAGPRRPMRPHR